MGKICSLKDIAAECGLSVSTVSEILKNSSRNFSSRQTRDRVHEVAARLGYKTNYGYRLMRGQKISTVAILMSLERIRFEEYMTTLMIELMTLFEQRGYASHLCSFSLDARENRDKVRDLLARGVGYFVALGAPVGHLEWAQEIEAGGGYILNIGHDMKNHIVPDTGMASRKLIRYLRSKAGDDFCFFPGFSEEVNPVRLAAMQEVFQLPEEEIIERFVYPERQGLRFSSSYFEWSYHATEKICKERPGVRAFFYLNDSLALGGIAYLARHGYRIGRDVWVAGHNNDTAIRNNPFPISSTDHDWHIHAPMIVEKVLNGELVSQMIPTSAHIREYEPETDNIREIDFE